MFFLKLALKLTPSIIFLTGVYQTYQPHLDSILLLSNNKVPSLTTARNNQPTPTPSHPTSTTGSQPSPTPKTNQPTTPKAQLPTNPPTTQTPITNPSQPAKNTLNSVVNNFRQSNGLNQLSNDQTTCDIANQRLSESTLAFNHDLFYQHLEKGDYNYAEFSQIAENLWQGPATPEEVVANWSNSTGHKDNLKGAWSRGCGAKSNQTAVYIFIK